MGQQIASAKSAGCNGAVVSEPVLTKPTPTVIAAGAGNTATVVYDAATGEKLPKGGVVLKSNECDRLKIDVSYASGGDCNACTADTIADVVHTYFAEAGGAGYDLKDYGFVTKIEVTVVDAAGAPTTSTLGNTISFESERAALCNEVLAA